MSLNFIFEPKSIAFCGISKDKKSTGRKILENLLNYGYLGRIFIINAKARKISHFISYSNILAIPAQIDIALIFNPIKDLPQILKQLGQKRVPTAIIFSDLGQDKLKNTILKIAENYEIKILGPNCSGIINPQNKLQLVAQKNNIETGNIGIINSDPTSFQFLLDLAQTKNIKIAKFLDLGNAWDINLAQSVNYLEKDKSTKIILIWLAKNTLSEKEIYTLQKAALRKPIIVFSPYRGVKKSLSKTGIIITDNVSGFFSLPKVILSYPKLSNKTLAVLTQNFSLAQLAVGKLKQKNLILAPLLENPKILKNDNIETFEQNLRDLSTNKSVENILVILQATNSSIKLRTLIEILKSYIQKSKKNIFICLIGGKKLNLAREDLENESIPYFEDLDTFIEIFDKILNYKDYLKNIRSQTKLFFFKKPNRLIVSRGSLWEKFKIKN